MDARRKGLSLLIVLTMGCGMASAGPPEVAHVPVAAGPSRQQYLLFTETAAKLHRYHREIAGIQDDLRRLGSKPFQDGARAGAFAQRLAKLQEHIDSLGSNDSGEVRQIATLLNETRQLLTDLQDAAAKQRAELGDFQVRLAAIDKQMRSFAELQELKPPFSAHQAEEFVRRINEEKLHAEVNMQDLLQIREKAYLPLQRSKTGAQIIYCRQDLDRFIYWTGKKLQQDLKAILLKTGRNIDFAAHQQEDNLAWYNSLDPGDPTDQANHFLGRGARAHNLEVFADKLEILASARVFYQALQREPPLDLEGMIRAVENTRRGYEIKYQQALAAVRMPKPVASDPALLEIARSTLENSLHGHEVERLIIVAPKTHREKTTTADIQTTTTGAAPFAQYVWEEFKAVSAEKVAGDYYLYANTFTRYHKGGPARDLEHWTVCDRVESSLIPRENINK